MKQGVPLDKFRADERQILVAYDLEHKAKRLSHLQNMLFHFCVSVQVYLNKANLV